MPCRWHRLKVRQEPRQADVSPAQSASLGLAGPLPPRGPIGCGSGDQLALEWASYGEQLFRPVRGVPAAHVASVQELAHGSKTLAIGTSGGPGRAVELASRAARAEGASSPPPGVTGGWPSRPPPGVHPTRQGREDFRRHQLRILQALPVRQRRGSGPEPGRPARRPARDPAPPGAGEACWAAAGPTRRARPG
jgi:hypothetical protein